MKSNNQGGLDYETVPENYRAKKVDLITFPLGITGVNCKNCMYVAEEQESLFCNNPKIKLPVTARMCCALYDILGASRSWKM